MLEVFNLDIPTDFHAWYRQNEKWIRSSIAEKLAKLAWGLAAVGTASNGFKGLPALFEIIGLPVLPGVIIPLCLLSTITAFLYAYATFWESLLSWFYWLFGCDNPIEEEKKQKAERVAIINELQGEIKQLHRSMDEALARLHQLWSEDVHEMPEGMSGVLEAAGELMEVVMNPPDSPGTKKRKEAPVSFLTRCQSGILWLFSWGGLMFLCSMFLLTIGACVAVGMTALGAHSAWMALIPFSASPSLVGAYSVGIAVCNQLCKTALSGKKQYNELKYVYWLLLSPFAWLFNFPLHKPEKECDKTPLEKAEKEAFKARQEEVLKQIEDYCERRESILVSEIFEAPDLATVQNIIRTTPYFQSKYENAGKIARYPSTTSNTSTASNDSIRPDQDEIKPLARLRCIH